MQYNCIMIAKAGVGSALLALLAHVPCCGPTALFALGGLSGGAGWAEHLEPYRGLFLAMSAMSLGVGFWGAYKKPHVCHDCGTCTSEAHAKRKAGIGAMWFVAALVVGITIVGFVNEAGHVH